VGEENIQKIILIGDYRPYGNNNGAPYMLTFKFPRRSDNGEPTIANDEKK